MRAILLLCLSFAPAFGCTCLLSIPVKTKLKNSDIVFRIVELRGGARAEPSSFARDAEKTVIFRVSHVWKGKVGPTVEMHAWVETSACIGFTENYLVVGNDLLIYASGKQGQYITSICGNHMLAKDAAKDLAALGPGHEPRK